jgi:hypothetical protein
MNWMIFLAVMTKAEVSKYIFCHSLFSSVTPSRKSTAFWEACWRDRWGHSSDLGDDLMGDGRNCVVLLWETRAMSEQNALASAGGAPAPNTPPLRVNTVFTSWVAPPDSLSQQTWGEVYIYFENEEILIYILENLVQLSYPITLHWQWVCGLVVGWATGKLQIVVLTQQWDLNWNLPVRELNASDWLVSYSNIITPLSLHLQHVISPSPWLQLTLQLQQSNI